jgi:nucleotide-binding universal stress UspA family protein
MIRATLTMEGCFHLERRPKMTLKRRMNLLLADDGSVHAQAAIELIRDFSLTPDSAVMVLRVFTPGQIPGIPEFETALERTRHKLMNAGIKTDADLVLGSPAEKIIEIAEAKKIKLILLGAKGLRATLGILLGGVAQQVVEYAHCPVWVVRAPYLGLKRILFVTDGSIHSQYSARYLSKFPLPDGVDLRVMHVIPPAAPPLTLEPYAGAWRAIYVPLSVEGEAKAQGEREQKAGTLLTRTCELFQLAGITSMPILRQGDAATEIIEYAKSNEIDLIVAGSRGLSEFEGWWVGSVSRKLVHYSNCSVLIVKRPGKEQSHGS